MSSPRSPPRGPKRSFSTAHKREDDPPSVRSRVPLPPQSAVVPDFGRSSKSVRTEKSHESDQERARSHWNATFDAALSGRSLKTNVDRVSSQSLSPIADPVRLSLSPHASGKGVLAPPARRVTGATYSDLELNLENERTHKEALESELHALKQKLIISSENERTNKEALESELRALEGKTTALKSEIEALREETRVIRKDKEAMIRSHGMSAITGEVGDKRSEDARAAVGATRHKSDAANQTQPQKNTTRSDSPKSKRLRKLEEMIEYKDIEIASIKDHNQRMEAWNKEELQKVRNLQTCLKKEDETRKKAEADLQKVEQRTNKTLQDLFDRSKGLPRSK